LVRADKANRFCVMRSSIGHVQSDGSDDKVYIHSFCSISLYKKSAVFFIGSIHIRQRQRLQTMAVIDSQPCNEVKMEINEQQTNQSNQKSMKTPVKLYN
jgi:hypothetical protein